MTQSLLGVINLDNTAKRYRDKEGSPTTPASNDAYYDASAAGGRRTFTTFWCTVRQSIKPRAVS